MNNNSSYRLEKIQYENIVHPKVKDFHQKMENLKKGMNIGMFIFIGGIGVQFIKNLLNKGESAGTISNFISTVSLTAIGIGFIVYFAFFLISDSYPKKNWKCPCCNENLPYVKPVGRKIRVINKAALSKIEESGVRIGQIEKSDFLIPEYCPDCKEKLLNL